MLDSRNIHKDHGGKKCRDCKNQTPQKGSVVLLNSLKYMGVSEVEVLVDDEDERRDGKGGKEA
jgi:hypothetical protein